MECEYNKQFWLENVLKKLYRKLHSLGAKKKPRNRRKKKRIVPVTYLNDLRGKSRKNGRRYQIITRSKKHKGFKKPTIQKPVKVEQRNTVEKFWNFVDEFFKSRPYLSKTPNSFFMSVKLPSSVNSHWNNIGHTISLRSRVINRQTSDKSTVPKVKKKKGPLKKKKNSVEEQKALVQSLFSQIQVSRMRRATDIISQEFQEETNAKKSRLCPQA